MALNVTNIIRRIPRAVILICLSIIVGFFILFTKLSPDAYVFVRYAWKDNTARNISLDSLLGNNVLFDFGTIIFDYLNINGSINILMAVTVCYLLVFYLKYFHFLYDLSVSKILLVFVASLVTYDANQLRFQLSLILLLYASSPDVSKKWSMILKITSFLTHILPITVSKTARFYFLPLLLTPFLIGTLISLQSRFIYYFEPKEFVFYKVLLLIIPNSISYWHYKSKHTFNFIADLAFAFTVIALFFVVLNAALAARFLEAGFLLYVIWWCTVRCTSKVLGAILWFFALTMMLSRIYNGVHAGSAEQFYFKAFS